ncbi:caspase family protein [Streptomyces sp. NPDC048669]|uniref:caspase family protein n=1 Tax=Streptomyces sp. NPDC048669 TaxID=3155267 RepID=UPI00342F57E6
MTLPKPATSRAILIGVSRYDVLAPIASVTGNLTDLKAVLTSHSSWNLPEEHCIVLPEPASHVQVIDAVREAAAHAKDTLLVYFSGHGLRDEASGDLYLALPMTQEGHAYTGLEFEHLRRAVRDADALRKIVVLDCCYAGLATLSSGSELAEDAAIDGAFLMAAAQPNRRARFAPGARNTVFTGELLRVMRQGVAGGPELLNVNAVYRQAHNNLVAQRQPEPQKSELNDAGSLSLIRNAQYRPADEALESQDELLAPEPQPPEDGSIGDPVVFTKRSGGCAMSLLVVALILALPLLWGCVVGDPGMLFRAFWQEDQPQIDLAMARVPETVASWTLLAAGAIVWVGYRRLVAPYELRISPDQITVIRGPKGLRDAPGPSAHYPWHRIIDSRVAWVPMPFSRRGRFLLALQLRSETPERIPRFSRHTWRSRPGGERFVADLGRLDCVPAHVDQAIKRFGGPAWSKSPDAIRPGYAAPVLAPERFTGLNLSTKRWRLTLLCVALTALALTPLTTVLLKISPWHYGLRFLPLALWTALLLLPNLVPAAHLRYPSTLTIDAKGVTHTRKGLTRRWEWSQIERIGVASWRRGKAANGALFIRPLNEPDLLGSHPRMPGMPPWAASRLGGILVCDLISLGARRPAVEAALLRFGGDSWDPGIRPEHGVVQDDSECAHFQGSIPGLRTILAVSATLIAINFLFGLVMDPLPTATKGALSYIGAYTFYISVALIASLVRDRFSLIVDPHALTLRISKRELVIPWHDVHAIGRSDAKRASDPELVVWLLEDAVPRHRATWKFWVGRSGAELRVMSLGTKASVLSAPTERVDAALRRFAQNRFRSRQQAPSISSGDKTEVRREPSEDRP